MAGNIYKIHKLSNDKIRTVITMYDGTVLTEEFPSGFIDRDILLKFNQDYYKSFPGSWTIVFTDEDEFFEYDKLSEAIQVALMHIYERDFPDYPDYFQ